MADSQTTVLTEVPVDASKLREELEAYAIPGFTGTVYAEIGLQTMADGLLLPVIRVTHHQHLLPADDGTQWDGVTPDPTLRKPVARVLERLIPKLVIKPAAHLIEFNFRQGHLSETVKVKG